MTQIKERLLAVGNANFLWLIALRLKATGTMYTGTLVHLEHVPPDTPALVSSATGVLRLTSPLIFDQAGSKTAPERHVSTLIFNQANSKTAPEPCIYIKPGEHHTHTHTFDLGQQS